MNKVLIGFNVVLAAAVVYLFFRSPSAPAGKKGEAAKEEPVKKTPMTSTVFKGSKGTGEIRIAFINSDSLSASYQLFKDAEAELNKLSMEVQKQLQSREQGLIATAKALEKDFNMKTLSEQQQAQQKMQNLEMAYNKYKEEQMTMLDKVRNDNLIKGDMALKKFLEGYCAENKIDYVLRDGMVGALFYGNPVYDITADVAKGLNAEYNNK
ncbi:MAG TPA: OmpH family outer membrane protein [Flavobacteriales bacterium]|nr:OmpH family outer membrane protein [Flavobacteriales bacterium]